MNKDTELTKQLVWETPKWESEIQPKDKRKRPRKVVTMPARFDNRREAVEWCRKHGIPLRMIQLTTVER